MKAYTTFSFFFLSLLWAFQLSGNTAESKIDSLYTLLESDTITASSKVKVMTSLIYKYKYKGEKAQKLFDNIDSICESEQLHYLRGKNFFNKTIRYNRTSQIDSNYLHAIHMIDSMARMAVAAKELPVLYSRSHANYTFKKEEYAASETHIQNSINAAKEQGYPKYLGSLYNELALRQRLQAKYFEAIDNYLHALEYDNVKKSYTYSNLAKIYRDMSDYENQLHYAELGRQVAIEEKVWNVRITCRLDIGRALYRMGKLDTAEMYILETLPIIEDSNVKVRVLIANEYLSRIYFDTEQWEKLAALETSMDDYEDGIFHAVYYAFLGHSFFKRGKYKIAKKLCERAYKAGHPRLKPHWTRAACGCLMDVYAESGQHELALARAKDVMYIDSITNSLERIMNISKAVTKKDLKQQEEFLALEQAKEAQKVELRLFRTQLISAFSILFFFIGLYAYYKLREKNNKIASQNQIIKKSLAEKNILLREIHHRVKNNLQVISSLFSMQMRHVEDDISKRILSDGKNRVRSIALIHQSLYQTDNISEVSFKKYVDDLTDNLFSTFEINHHSISLELDIDDVQLDLETMISLGLILNELLSNCFKHAFQEGEKGSISVKLDEVDNQLILNVTDNGKGMNHKQFDKKSSFGNKLVKAFSKKLKADLKVDTTNGTSITMTINKYQKTA